jgi:hypothetical protein
MKKKFSAFQLINIIVTILILLLFFYGLNLYFSNLALQEKEEISITNSQPGTIQPENYEIIYFNSSNNESIAQTQVLINYLKIIYLKQETLVERTINIKLYSNKSVDIYLINSSLVQTTGNIEKTIRKKTVYKWLNATILDENIKNTSAYFPALIIFNKNNNSIAYNVTLNQKITFLHPNYDLVFKGYWLSINSFIFLNLFYIIIFILSNFKSSQIRILNVFDFLQYLAVRSEYKAFLQIEKEQQTSKKSQIILLLIALCLSCFIMYLSNHLELIYGEDVVRLAKSNYHLLNLLKIIEYSILISMLIFLAVYWIINHIIFENFYVILSKPRYYAFRDPNEYKMHILKEDEILQNSIVPILIYTFDYFIIFYPLWKHTFILDSFPYIFLFSLTPLIAGIGLIMEYESEKHLASLNPFREKLIIRFELCVGSLLMGFTILISSIVAYYFIPWNILNNQTLLQEILQKSFSGITSLFLIAPYTAPVLFLPLYLSLGKLPPKHSFTEDKKYRNTCLDTRLETTIISFSASLLYNIFYKASKSSGDPIKRIIDGILSVLNFDSLTTSLLISLTIMLVKEYVSLKKYMTQLKEQHTIQN